MHPYPHRYVVAASAQTAGALEVTADGLPALQAAPPPQFDGPEGSWSPETLLAAAVASCFVLTFRGVARASGFSWTDLHCEVEATLDRQDGKARFTQYLTRVVLTIPDGADEPKALALLERAEQSCLVANSLSGTRRLEARLERSPATALPG